MTDTSNTNGAPTEPAVAQEPKGLFRRHKRQVLSIAFAAFSAGWPIVMPSSYKFGICLWAFAGVLVIVAFADVLNRIRVGLAWVVLGAITVAALLAVFIEGAGHEATLPPTPAHAPPPSPLVLHPGNVECEPIEEGGHYFNRSLTELRESHGLNEDQNLGIETIVQFREEAFTGAGAFRALGIADDEGTLLMSFCDDSVHDAKVLVAGKKTRRVRCRVASGGPIISLTHCRISKEDVTPTVTPSATPTPTPTSASRAPTGTPKPPQSNATPSLTPAN